MAGFVEAARVTDIPPGSGRSVSAGGREIALFNVDGDFFALENNCAHMGGPLGEGELEGSKVTCPWHRWEYDVKTGKNFFDAGIAVQRFETKVQDGKVFVKLP